MGKIKVFVEDGCYPCVMGTDDVMNIEVEIIDYDSDCSSKKLLEEEYHEEGFREMNFFVNHCTEEEDE